MVIPKGDHVFIEAVAPALRRVCDLSLLLASAWGRSYFNMSAPLFRLASAEEYGWDARMVRLKHGHPSG